MRPTVSMALVFPHCVLLCFMAGCVSTVVLDETSPVLVRGERPPPPPPPEPPPRVEVEEDRIRVDEKIHFEFDKAEIAADSDDLLREIAQVIKDNPQLTRIRVEGHTDNQGNADYNEDLSDRRANAVVERLVENGVARERLDPVGYGLNRPIADNETDEGRAQNRRVEFNILERDQSLANTGEESAEAEANAEAAPEDATDAADAAGDAGGEASVSEIPTEEGADR